MARRPRSLFVRQQTDNSSLVRDTAPVKSGSAKDAVSTSAGEQSACLADPGNLEDLDTVPEAEFDALVQVTSIVWEAPVSLISLIESNRQWVKANVDLSASKTPHDLSFSADAALEDELRGVPDAGEEPRFVEHPLVSRTGRSGKAESLIRRSPIRRIQ